MYSPLSERAVVPAWPVSWLPAGAPGLLHAAQSTVPGQCVGEEIAEANEHERRA